MRPTTEDDIFKASLPIGQIGSESHWQASVPRTGSPTDCRKGHGISEPIIIVSEVDGSLIHGYMQHCRGSLLRVLACLFQEHDLADDICQWHVLHDALARSVHRDYESDSFTELTPKTEAM